MKVVRFHEYGAPDVLKYEDLPDPVAGPGEILIRIKAIGVNFADTIRRKNDPYPLPTPLPCVLGMEVAGVIEALGEGVEGPAVGTPVFAVPGEGGYAELISCPAPTVIPLPPGIDFELAAALPLQGLTAGLMVKDAARIKAGDTVLIHAAAGGVGYIAIQLAKLAGAKVIGTASTPEKRQIIFDAGADEVVDYTQPGWVEAVKAASGGAGVDVILEMVGGQVLRDSLLCLAPFGKMIVYGLASRDSVLVDPQQLLAINGTVTGFNVGGYFSRPEMLQETLTELITHLMTGNLKLNIATTFPLSQAAAAHEMIESRQNAGKIVLLA